jgi:Transcriptional regulators, similar to M. xanthus CarD
MPVKKKATTKKVTKKTSKVNTKKKVEVKKKTPAKKKKPIKKIPKKKVVKKLVKKVVKKIVTPKAPKIKKVIVPQEFKAGENIVYPTHGVGRILTIEKFQYDLVEEQLYVIQFFQDKLTIRVPL